MFIDNMSPSDPSLRFFRLLFDVRKNVQTSLESDLRSESSLEEFINYAVTQLNNSSNLGIYTAMMRTKVMPKDNDSAEIVRKRGLSYYKKSNLKMAMDFCNRSIKLSFHPPLKYVSDNQHSTYQNLSFSYVNRAAVLFEMGLYDEACSDIRRAVNLGYSGPKQNLSVRYSKSLIYIHLEKNPESPITNSVFEDVFEKSEADLKCTLDDEQRKQIRNHTFDVKKGFINKIDFPKYIEVPKPTMEGQHPNILGLSSKVEFAAKINKGRYLIAGEDIYPGSLLAIDPGFTASTLDQEHVGEYCSACSKPCKFTFVPCHQCISAVFCNEQCRDEAFKSYHHYECSVLPLFYIMKVYSDSYLTLRIITSLGYSKLHEYVKSFKREEIEKKPSFAKRGFSSKGVYDPKSYRAVYYLTHYKKKNTVHELFNKSVLAVVMTFILKKCTSFFGEEDVSSEEIVNNVHFNECEMFIAKLILRHLISMQLIRNVTDNFTIEGSSELWKRKIIGGNIPCLNSLFGHSCNPNAFQADSFTLRSNAFIPKGTEICIGITSPFTKLKKEDRQQILSMQYHITCDCIACVEDWQMEDKEDDTMADILVKCLFGCKNGTLDKCTPRCTNCSNGLNKQKSLYSVKYLKYINSIIYGSNSENEESIKKDMALTTENLFTELHSHIKSFLKYQLTGMLSHQLEETKRVAYNTFKGIYLFDTYGACPSHISLFKMRNFLASFYDSLSNRVIFV